MQPNDTKKTGQAKMELSEIKDEAKRAVEELGADELAAVENISGGLAQDVVVCNSHCA